MRKLHYAGENYTSMKRILYIIAIILSLFVIKHLTTSIYDLWKKQDLITLSENELSAEEQKNRVLKRQLAVVESKEFVEEQSRNKLFLVKPGEQTIVIPDELLPKKKQDTQLHQEPNWVLWLKFFSF